MRINSTILAASLLPLIAAATAGCSEHYVTAPYGSGDVEFECEAERLPGQITDTYNIPDFRVSAFRNHQWGSDILMDNIVVTRTGINSWIYSPPVDWPENESVDFFAVSPASQTITNNQWWHHTFRYENKSSDTDLLVSVNIGVKQQSGRIRLNFRHALAKIQIRLKCSDPDHKVSVSDVELCNITQYGEFYFPSHSTTPDTNRGEIFDCWHTYGKQNDITVFHPVDNSVLDLTSDPVTIGPDNLFLIPDTLSSFNPEIIWEGTHIHMVYSADGIQTEARIPLRDSTPETRWLPGRNYRYTIDVKPFTRTYSDQPQTPVLTCEMK